MSKAEMNNVDPRKMSVEEFVALLEASNGAMDPQVFARLIKHASPEQLSALLDEPRRRAALLDAIFSRMAGQFRPENAPKRDSAVHWRITGGPNGEDVYETWITGTQGGSAPQCSTSAQPSHDPRVTLTMAGDQFLALVSGNSSPAMMFITGKVTLDGDIGFAAALANIFDMPHA
ncbi:MAG TPA: SCP2 sterol-binding domain-containing protein [Tepidiformaceae bacterium]|nr:SCP2 sterol-binding domain-containing protein [Pseudonocardiaceae bacterium]HKS92812.1 SCP2 sterol-binding domain-containing protein [Tepidiformaceae bacterium]